MRLTYRQRSKFRNVRVEYDGQWFDSKHERDCYIKLVDVYGKWNVIRQVSLPIGEKRIRVDFMVIADQLKNARWKRFVFMDAKGIITEAWKAKANHLKDKHGIEIKILDREWLKS